MNVLTNERMSKRNEWEKQVLNVEDKLIKGT